MTQFSFCRRPTGNGYSVFRRLIPVMLASGGLMASGYSYGVSCSVNTVGSVDFGVYDVFSSEAKDVSGKINVSCQDLLVVGVAYNILLSTGGGTYASRTLSDGYGHFLAYNLYTDANRVTPVWGDGTGGTGTVSGVFDLGVFSRNRDHDIYGRIPPGQNVNVGIYNDTITVTVIY